MMTINVIVCIDVTYPHVLSQELLDELKKQVNKASPQAVKVSFILVIARGSLRS